jgi:hypothetical protein
MSLPLLPEISEPPLAKAALLYAQAGLLVFPLRPREKVPIVKRGLHAATTDEKQIERWWWQFPQANIGIPTGRPSGWIVLDVDPRHGGCDSLKKLQQIFQHHADASCRNESPLKTLAQRTGGGGLHLVFSTRNDLDRALRNTVRFAGYPGLDLRAEGGYIVVAPSQHASGERYGWMNKMQPRLFPDLLVVLTRARQRGYSSPTRDTGQLVSGAIKPPRRDPAYWLRLALAFAHEGTRHHYALFLACRLLQEAGLSPAQAELWLRNYARQVPHGRHPYPVTDVLACLDWAATHVI